MITAVLLDVRALGVAVGPPCPMPALLRPGRRKAVGVQGLPVFAAVASAAAFGLSALGAVGARLDAPHGELARGLAPRGHAQPRDTGLGGSAVGVAVAVPDTPGKHAFAALDASVLRAAIVRARPTWGTSLADRMASEPERQGRQQRSEPRQGLHPHRVPPEERASQGASSTPTAKPSRGSRSLENPHGSSIGSSILQPLGSEHP